MPQLNLLYKSLLKSHSLRLVFYLISTIQKRFFFSKKTQTISNYPLQKIYFSSSPFFYNLIFFSYFLFFLIYLTFEFIDTYNYILYLINIITGNITMTNICCVYLISYLSIYIKNLLYSSFYICHLIKLINNGSDKQIILTFVYICLQDIYVKYKKLIILFFIFSLYLNAYLPVFFDVSAWGFSIIILFFSLYVYIYINHIDTRFKYKYYYLYILLNIVTIILMLISIILLNLFTKILSEKLCELLKDNSLNVKGGSSNKPEDNNSDSDSDKGNPYNKPNNPNKGKNPDYNPVRDREESEDEPELKQEDLYMTDAERWAKMCRDNHLNPETGEALFSGPSNLGASNSNTLDTSVPRKKYVRTDYTELEDWEIKDIKKASKAQYDSKYYGKNKEIISKKQKDYYETHKQAIGDDQKLYREINKVDLSHKKRKYNDEHREEISKYNSNYYEENYDKVNERNKVNREKPENKSKQDTYNKQYRKDNLDDLRQYDRNRRTDEKSKLAKKEYDKMYRKQKQDSLSEEQKEAQREKARIRKQIKRAKDKEDKEKKG